MNQRSVAVCLTTALVLALSLRPSAQESLTSARQLYASAEYKSALNMLDGLIRANPSAPDRQAMDLYRTFCLVALGSVDEASAAVDAMITRDPLYHPSLDEVPPRLRTLFSNARKKLLPGIIQQRYTTAKAAFDRNEYKTAREGFTQLLIALSDPDIAQAAGQPPLADLRVLATGFNDLAIRALTPPPAPPPAAPPAVASGPIVPPPVPGAGAGPAPASATRVVEVYTKDTPNVVEPVMVRQNLPPYPGRVTTPKIGVIDIVIDENGAVESATMVESVDPLYNRILITAAKSWTYQPAKRDGMPVKFRRRIQVNLTQAAPSTRREQ